MLNTDRDFVRYFGTVRLRSGGGVGGWVDEERLVEARRAIAFLENQNFRYVNKDTLVKLYSPFRRFFFDGTAIGKFELGIASRNKKRMNLNAEETKALLLYIANFPVKVRDIAAPKDQGYISCSLIDVDEHLAALYLRASSKKPLEPTHSLNRWWVRSGTPLMFMNIESGEDISVLSIPSTRHIPISSKSGLGRIELFHSLIKNRGRLFPVWIMKVPHNRNSEAIRRLRIYLMRLHAEQEGFRLITGAIRSREINPLPRSGEAEKLQTYLRDTRSYIKNKKEKLAEGYGIKDEIEQFATMVFGEIYPNYNTQINEYALSAVEEINARLDEIDIRKQTRESILPLVQEINRSMAERDIISKHSPILFVNEAVITMSTTYTNNQGTINGNFGETHFNHSFQTINSLQGIANSDKEPLSNLFKLLQQELNTLSPDATETDKQNAEAVAQAARKLVESASDETEAKEIVEVRGNKLKEAAEKIQSVLPKVLEIAGDIVSFALKFVAMRGAGL